MPDGSGNAAQTRIIAEQVGDAAAATAIKNFMAANPEMGRPREAQIPPPLKWAGMLAGAVLTAGGAAMALWVVTTVNNMQVMLARMEERMASMAGSQDSRFTDLSRRVGNLETDYPGGRQDDKRNAN